MGIGDQKIHNHKEGFEKEIANIATQDPATFFNQAAILMQTSSRDSVSFLSLSSFPSSKS